MKITLPKIYPITDRELSGRSHLEQVEMFISGGATLIQLRDKTAASAEFFEDAAAAVRFAHGRGARIMINDRVDIALMSGADGVHVGQNDLPPAEARKILGPGAVVGLSTHNAQQVKEARDLPIDYIAFGPIFLTSTKPDPDPVVGLSTLEEVRQLIGSLPLVAIGGIRADNLRDVLAAGADAVAMISDLYRPGIDVATRYLELSRMVSSE